MSRSPILPLLIAVAIAADASAQPIELIQQLSQPCREEELSVAPTLAITDERIAIRGAVDAARPVPQRSCVAEQIVVGQTADKQVAWVAGDAGRDESACGSVHCSKVPPLVDVRHGVVLIEADAKAPTGWRHVAWMYGKPVSAKEQAAAGGKAPSPIATSIEPGAEDVAKLFETSLADPEALARSVSKRKDVVLYGSELAERTVGGAKVSTKLASWKLVLKPRDGIAAGLTTNKAVAWVAANLDATSRKKPAGKPTPYRVLFLYEKTRGAWQLVHAQFAFVR